MRKLTTPLMLVAIVVALGGSLRAELTGASG